MVMDMARWLQTVEKVMEDRNENRWIDCERKNFMVLLSALDDHSFSAVFPALIG